MVDQFTLSPLEVWLTLGSHIPSVVALKPRGLRIRSQLTRRVRQIKPLFNIPKLSYTLDRASALPTRGSELIRARTSLFRLDSLAPIGGRRVNSTGNELAPVCPTQISEIDA